MVNAPKLIRIISKLSYWDDVNIDVARKSEFTSNSLGHEVFFINFE